MYYVNLYLTLGFFATLAFFVYNNLTREEKNKALFASLKDMLKFLLAALLFVVTWPYWIYEISSTAIHRKKQKNIPSQKEIILSKYDLKEAISIETIEKNERIFDPLGAVPDLPFGHLYAQWEKFASLIQHDDEIWSFSAKQPDSSSTVHEGYAIVRREVIVHFLLTDQMRIVAQQDSVVAINV